MSQSTLVKSLPIIAKALGRNMGVRVEVDAGHPRTDGNVIYLPSLPLDKNLAIVPHNCFKGHYKQKSRSPKGTAQLKVKNK